MIQIKKQFSLDGQSVEFVIKMPLSDLIDRLDVDASWLRLIGFVGDPKDATANPHIYRDFIIKILEQVNNEPPLQLQKEVSDGYQS